MWAPVRVELLLGWAMLLGIATAQAASPALPPLPPDPPTGFHVRYKVDGRQVSQTLYGFRHHAHAILVPADEAPGNPLVRTLRLTIKSHSSDAVQEGVELHVQDRLRLDARGAQRFVLSGGAFCRPAAEQPQDSGARAEYALARAGTPATSGGHFRWGIPLSAGTLDDERASRDPLGYITGAPGLTGSFEGELVVTRVDRDQQVLEGRFSFDAGRHFTARRRPTGEWEGRCTQAGDFDVGRVRITDGEFRLRYCVEPAQPGNSRYCPGGLAPQGPR